MSLSSEILVNASFTDGNQLRPSVSTNTQGNYLIAWYGLGAEGNGIYARKFRFDGNSNAGSEFRIPISDNLLSINPSVVLRNDDTFVLVWQGLRISSDENPEGTIVESTLNIQDSVQSEMDIGIESFEADAVIRDGFRIFVQVYDGDEGLSYASQVSSQDLGEQLYPVVSAFPDGSFVVAWQQQVPCLDIEDIACKSLVKARIYDRNGTPKTNPFQISTIPGENFSRPSIVSLSSGNFIVALVDKDTNFLYIQKYDNLGRPQSEATVVNDSTTKILEHEYYPIDRLVSIDAGLDDNFVVAWTTEAVDSPGSESESVTINVRVFDSMLNPLTVPLKVDSLGEGHSTNPCVAMDGEGNFAVIWEWAPENWEERPGVYVKNYRSDGVPLGTEVKINAEEFIEYYKECSGEISPVIDMDDSGNFIAAWMNGDIDVGVEGIDIYARQSGIEGINITENYVNRTPTKNSSLFVSSGTSSSFNYQNISETFGVEGIGISLSVLSIIAMLYYLQKSNK
jgi:hypothetical protein